MLVKYGVSKGNIVHLQPGSHPIFRPQGSDEKNTKNRIELLFVGWFDNCHKGYHLFLHALSKVDNQVSARIIGAGDPHQRLIDELDLNERVRIEGFKPRKELPDVYNTSDITVVPYTDEMGPNIQIESLACGTPVVTTDEKGLNEYPDPNSAVFFSPRTPDALADAIREAIENLPKMTEYTKENSQSYNGETTVKHLSEIYNNL
jgi:glycosyltransferase involved in cell wall biosynthesis